MVIITKSIILNHSLVYTLCTTLQQFTFSKLAAKVSTVLQCCMHIGFENVFLLPLLRVEASSCVTQTYTDMTVRITSINDHSSENRLHSSSLSTLPPPKDAVIFYGSLNDPISGFVISRLSGKKSDFNFEL